MRKRTYRSYLSLVLSVTMVFGLIVSIASAAETDSQDSPNAAVAADTKVGSILFNNNQTKMIVSNLMTFTLGNEKVLSFNAEFQNYSSKEIDFIDYWLKVRTKSGADYSLSLIESDKDNDEISPQSIENFTFYAYVNNNVEVNDVIIDLIEWDFDATDFEKILGSITVPDDYSSLTHVNQYAEIANDNRKMQLSVKEAEEVTSGEDQSIRITLEAYNSNTRSFSIPDMNYYLKTSNGLIYDLTPVQSMDSYLQPQNTEEFVFSGKVPVGISLVNSQLIATRTESTGTELPLAMLHLRFSEPVSTSDGTVTKKTITISEEKVETWASKVEQNTFDDEQDLISVDFNFKNIGTETVTPPAYEFQLETEDGTIYPLTALDELSQLTPQVTEEIELEGKVPSNLDLENIEIQLFTEETDSIDSYLVAVYQAVVTDSDDSQINAGQEQEYTNESGLYGIRLESMRRLPLEDQDIIAADFAVTNKDTKSLPIPELTGTFKLNEVEVDDAKMSVKNEEVAIDPGESVEITIYTQIPYTYATDEVEVELSEVQGDALEEIETFVTTSVNENFEDVGVSESYVIETTGKRAEVRVIKRDTFTESGNKLYYLLAEIENLESRQLATHQLVAQLKIGEDVYLPLTIDEVESTISPKSETLVGMWAYIPDSLLAGSKKVIIGEEVDGEEGVYLSAAQLDVPSEDSNVNRTFIDIDLYPYELTIRNVEGNLATKTVEFDYELNNPQHYDSIPDGHNVVIEFTQDDAEYSETYELGTDIELGDSDESIVFSLPNLYDDISSTDEFKLRVYHEYNGYKKLVAERRIDWD